MQGKKSSLEKNGMQFATFPTVKTHFFASIFLPSFVWITMFVFGFVCFFYFFGFFSFFYFLFVGVRDKRIDLFRFYPILNNCVWNQLHGLGHHTILFCEGSLSFACFNYISVLPWIAETSSFVFATIGLSWRGQKFL